MPGTPPTSPRPGDGAARDEVWDVDQEWLDAEAERTLAYEDSRFDGPDGVVPTSFDDDGFGDEELLAMRGPASGWDVALLSSIDPATLTTAGRLDYLRRVEAAKALVSAMEARATVALAGTDGSDSRQDRHVAMEVAVLRRVGEGAASTGIATARALHSDFPAFLSALSEGEVSEWHCRILVSETVNVHDRGTLAALQDRLLPKAKRRTPTEFRRLVRAAVADLDAEREAERVERARADRYVSCRQLPDGMGYLGLVTDWPTISAMHQTITADGRALQLARGGAKAARAGDDDALADSCRADAFATRVLGRVEEDGSVVFDPTEIPVSLTLVMDLDTLRGEADRHALLDGEPVPAGIAREFAGAAKTWRRAVTDPVTGHLLDYGRERYLPDKLRDYVLARDHCRQPGCTTKAPSRLQMDHAIPFPEGETSAANCGGWCGKHHQDKTDGHLHLVETAADGSGTWITAWGQRITIPPRPFLHDPADPPPPTRRPDPDGDHPEPDPPPSAGHPTVDPPTVDPPTVDLPTAHSTPTSPDTSTPATDAPRTTLPAMDLRPLGRPDGPRATRSAIDPRPLDQSDEPPF